tara:strand:+ start:95 stop:328 length:234 start_codon:yes stop_codon:yes gene_type:complete
MIKTIVLEKIAQAIAKKFKLKKILKYVEDPNDADNRIDELETIQFQQGRLIEFILKDMQPKESEMLCSKCKKQKEKK